MFKDREYRFKIDAFTPATVPMARLAEYMMDLAEILGEPQNVHFVRVEEGSLAFVQQVDDVAVPKVRERVKSVRAGNGPQDAMKAYHRTNKKLKHDNCVGSLNNEAGAEVIHFPGRKEEEHLSFGAFSQEGSLDGTVIVIGGRGDPVPVHIQRGDVVYNCFANRNVAKTLGHHLFTTELRVHGTGRWQRDEDGAWQMQRFTIATFEVLDDRPLSDVVARLRDIPGSGWKDVADPFAELMELRGNGDEAQ